MWHHVCPWFSLCINLPFAKFLHRLTCIHCSMPESYLWLKLSSLAPKICPLMRWLVNHISAKLNLLFYTVYNRTSSLIITASEHQSCAGHHLQDGSCVSMHWFATAQTATFLFDLQLNIITVASTHLHVVIHAHHAKALSFASQSTPQHQLICSRHAPQTLFLYWFWFHDKSILCTTCSTLIPHDISLCKNYIHHYLQ